MSQTYFVKGLIDKVLAYGGLQIRTSLPHGLQPTNERRAESKLAYAMPSKEEEDDSQIPADITILLKDTCSRGSPAPRVI